MKRFLGALIVAVAVLGFAVSHVLARGGGHGGGHHGGGHHGGHHGSHHHSHHAGHHHAHHHSDHHYHHSGWAHHNRPFSHGWYGRHGGAWGRGWGGWGWGNPWGVATFGTAAAWLGLEGLNNATPIAGNYGGPTIVNNTDETPVNQNVPQTQTADAGDDEDDDDVTPEVSEAQVAEANKLLKSGTVDPGKDTKFLPLGVFTLAPKGHEEASALAQLAVSKDGSLRGTYYDLLSDSGHPIRGAVDKNSQRVVFSFGDKGKVTFETSLANLTQETGGALVHFENGESRPWTLARYEKEPTEQDEANEAADEAADKAEEQADDAQDKAPEAPSAPAIH